MNGLGLGLWVRYSPLVRFIIMCNSPMTAVLTARCCCRLVLWCKTLRQHRYTILHGNGKKSYTSWWLQRV